MPHVTPDKAYDADARMRDKLKDKGCTAVIPPKKNRVNPANYDKNLYKARHLIENLFCKIEAIQSYCNTI